MSVSKAVSEYIKYISFLIANHFYLNAQYTDFLSSEKSLWLFRSEVKIQPFEGGILMTTPKTQVTSKNYFLHFAWMFSDGSNLSVIYLVSITLIQYLIFINFLGQPNFQNLMFWL